MHTHIHTSTSHVAFEPEAFGYPPPPLLHQPCSLSYIRELDLNQNGGQEFTIDARK